MNPISYRDDFPCRAPDATSGSGRDSAFRLRSRQATVPTCPRRYCARDVFGFKDDVFQEKVNWLIGYGVNRF